MRSTRLHSIPRRTILLSLGGVAFASALAGETEYTISRSSLRGGANRSQGGGFELSSTIGQPAAAAKVGGEFEMTGGFRIAHAPTDCDEGGSVNLVDFAGFQACLAGPDQSTVVECHCYDTDGDGAVDLWDFSRAQAAFDGR